MKVMGGRRSMGVRVYALRTPRSATYRLETRGMASG